MIRWESYSGPSGPLVCISCLVVGASVCCVVCIKLWSRFFLFVSSKTAVHNGDTKEAWCDQEMISSLLIAVKRGSYDIYKALVGTGVIGPPDKLMYEEQYLTSVDIVRDLLQVSFSCFSTYSR